MGGYTAHLEWQRAGARFTDLRYSRAHRWRFDGGVEVPASSSPHVVPTPMSDPSAVDPEEAFVAALSSCHMLSFLAIAARSGFIVERYEDDPEGVMARNDAGRHVIIRVTLRPRVQFDGAPPDRATEEALHRQAHEACYLANSVRTEVVVEVRAWGGTGYYEPSRGNSVRGRTPAVDQSR